MNEPANKILFCSVPNDITQMLLALFEKANNPVESKQLTLDTKQNGHLSDAKWDFAIALMQGGTHNIDFLLSYLNHFDPSLPVVLLYDPADEIKASRLLTDDAQLQLIVSLDNLDTLPTKLIELNNSIRHNTRHTPIENTQPDAEQFRKFVEIAHEGIWVIDDKGITTYVNPAMASMLGYSVEEMTGKHLFHFMDERGVEITKRNIRRREQGIIDQHDFELLRKDGTRIYTIMETSPIVENGVYQGSIAGVINVSPKYKTEQTLRRTNRALRTTRKCIERIVRATEEQNLLDNICHIIATTGGYDLAWIGYAENDADKRVVPVAHSGNAVDYVKQLNVSWSETNSSGQGPTGTAIRTGKADITRNISSEARFQPWRDEAKARGYASSIALPLNSPDGTFGAINIYSNHADAFDTEEQQLLQELADDLAFGILALRDHNARLQMESELRLHQEHLEELVSSRTAELERSNQELESFSYTVSHDLRAPLRHINGYCHLLAEEYSEKLDADALQYLQRMQNATQRMSDLIDHMLTLGRINQQDLHLEPVNLSNIATGIINHLIERHPSNTTRVTIAENVNVIADKNLISVVLQNLLDNAWKFTRHTKEPVIEFGVTHDDGKLVYFVSDNGIGFDMAYVGTLFRTFNRLHTQDEYEGSGIGLVSVQRAIQRHGGRIWVEASEGKGATFYFTLNTKQSY